MKMVLDIKICLYKQSIKNFIVSIGILIQAILFLLSSSFNIHKLYINKLLFQAVLTKFSCSKYNLKDCLFNSKY